MGRKIILLSDGTGNSAAKVWRTNVWRTFEALDLSGSDQIAFYDDGVGTSSFKPWAILGGVFGFGLKRNVLAIYKFACRNHRDETDQLFGFGFSRGAFTIRIVMGLIVSEGLVRAETESDLSRGALDAYRAYRRKNFSTFWPGHPEEMFRNVRDYAVHVWRKLIRVDPAPASHASRNVAIRFLGVWDTVAAYGMPIDEMTRGISRWIWPLGLPNHQFDRARIARGCQALALDEARTTFHPELWNEKAGDAAEIDPTKPRAIADEQISQVWFPGVHSNVGGGYPDDSLAYIPFVWMITQARHCGLAFKSDFAGVPTGPTGARADPDTFKSAISRRDKDGRLYDPRKGLGSYYRYGPRKLVLLNTPQFIKKEDDEILVDRPKIHESVFKRIQNHAHVYAPVGLPAKYDVVTDDGDILTPDQYRARNPWAESNEEAAQRAHAQEHAWNRIWWRKLVYFCTLLATFWLIALPFINDAEPNAETFSRVRWISAIIRFVGSLFPGFAQPWIEGYARAPIVFLISALIVVLFVWLASKIAGDTSDTMSLIWNRSPNRRHGEPRDLLYRLRSWDAYNRFIYWVKRRGAPGLFAILTVYAAIFSASKISFLTYDVAGYTCVDRNRNPSLSEPRTLARKEKVSADFDIANLCNRTRIALEGNGARYRVSLRVGVNPEDQWRDGPFAVPPGGYSSKAPMRTCPWRSQTVNRPIEAASWPYRLYGIFWLPWRRVYTQDWDRIILRFGSEGAEEDYYRPDPDDCLIQWTVAPKRGGELFVYLNDAIIGVPGVTNLFYLNNYGKGTLTVERL